MLRNLPELFNKYAFPDGHYRVYLQEAGSNRIRLILDVHVYEGRVVPENFRESESGAGDEAISAPPSNANETEEASTGEEQDAAVDQGENGAERGNEANEDAAATDPADHRPGTGHDGDRSHSVLTKAGRVLRRYRK